MTCADLAESFAQEAHAWFSRSARAAVARIADLRSGGRRRGANAVRSHCACRNRKRVAGSWRLEKAGCAILQSEREKKNLRRNQRELAWPLLIVRMLVVAELHRMVAGGDLRTQ